MQLSVLFVTTNWSRRRVEHHTSGSPHTIGTRCDRRGVRMGYVVVRWRISVRRNSSAPSEPLTSEAQAVLPVGEEHEHAVLG